MSVTEQIWAHTDRYVGKVLRIAAGESSPLQFHAVRDKTVIVLSGRANVVYYAEGEPPRTLELKVKDSFRIEPQLRHRFDAVEDTEMLEASTTELDDVVVLG